MKTTSQRIKEKIKEGIFFRSLWKVARNRTINWARFHNAHYFLNPERVFARYFEHSFKPIDDNHIEVGNYFIDKRVPLSDNSIVYSAGILQDISFDKAIVEKYNSTVFMFDPTPISIEFIKQQEPDPRLKFFPLGVWIENCSLRFFLPATGGSASALVGDEKLEFFDAPCKTIATFMAENGHKSINLLKMDIEGAALFVTEQIIEQKIFPDQLVVEFERPANDLRKNVDFFYRTLEVCRKMEKEGYEITRLPRGKAKYYSIELLFARVKKEIQQH